MITDYPLLTSKKMFLKQLKFMLYLERKGKRKQTNKQTNKQIRDCLCLSVTGEREVGSGDALIYREAKKGGASEREREKRREKEERKGGKWDRGGLVLSRAGPTRQDRVADIVPLLFSSPKDFSFYGPAAHFALSSFTASSS